jgi:hypothetical protein
MIMQDYAAFCRQRLLACFHRRRKYPLGSEDREQAVSDARAFLRYYREEIEWQKIDSLATALEIAAPLKATAEERRQWVAWWTLSYEAARTLSDEQKASLKSGGWWPPLSASMIGIAPEIVRRTARPGLSLD